MSSDIIAAPIILLILSFVVTRASPFCFVVMSILVELLSFRYPASPPLFTSLACSLTLGAFLFSRFEW